jgi:hypothetical protein
VWQHRQRAEETFAPVSLRDSISAWTEIKRQRQASWILPMGERRNYCQWRGNSGRQFFSFADEVWFHLSSYVNSQNSCVWTATKTREIKIHHYMIRILVCDAPYHKIRKSAQYSSKTQQHGTLLCSDSLPLRWTFKWGRNFSRLPPTTHSSRFIKLLRDVFGDRIISKNIWPPWSPVVYYLWRAMRVAIYKDSPYTLSLN